MSRELCLKLLADPSVQKLSSTLCRKPEFIATKAVEYAHGLSGAIERIEDEDVVAVAVAMLPSAFCFYVTKQITGAEVADRIISQSASLVENVLFAEKELDEREREQKEREAEALRVAEAEAKAIAEKEEAERVAAEVARREAIELQEAARKAEVARVVEQKEKLEAEAKARKEAELAANKEADEKKAASDVPVVDDGESLTAAELESLPVGECGLPKGIVTDLIKGRISTVGQLMMLGEAQDGDFSIIHGIGDTSSTKINERLVELKSRVKE